MKHGIIYQVVLTHKEGGHKTLQKVGDQFQWTVTMFKQYVTKFMQKFPVYTFCSWPPEPMIDPTNGHPKCIAAFGDGYVFGAGKEIKI